MLNVNLVVLVILPALILSLSPAPKISIPGACNGCDKFMHFRFDKYVYKPDLAHKDYRSSLIDNRLDINATPEDIRELRKIFAAACSRTVSLSNIYISSGNNNI